MPTPALVYIQKNVFVLNDLFNVRPISCHLRTTCLQHIYNVVSLHTVCQVTMNILFLFITETPGMLILALYNFCQNIFLFLKGLDYLVQDIHVSFFFPKKLLKKCNILLSTLFIFVSKELGIRIRVSCCEACLKIHHHTFPVVVTRVTRDDTIHSSVVFNFWVAVGS